MFHRVDYREKPVEWDLRNYPCTQNDMFSSSLRATSPLTGARGAGVSTAVSIFAFGRFLTLLSLGLDFPVPFFPDVATIWIRLLKRAACHRAARSRFDLSRYRPNVSTLVLQPLSLSLSIQHEHPLNHCALGVGAACARSRSARNSFRPRPDSAHPRRTGAATSWSPPACSWPAAT